MRSYPVNSPQAAARIVVLALLADGHLSKVEMQALDALHAHEQLGLTRPELHAVVHGFCEDLLSTHGMNWGEVCRIDAWTMSHMLAEVADPRLRLTVLNLCVAVVEADAHVDDAESLVLVSAVEQWGLQRDMLQTTTPQAA